MNPKILTPQETHAVLTTNSAAVYIDVRTVAEFAAGHPRGKVVNIPFVFHHPTTKDIYPNTSFLEVIEALYDKAAPLIVGCDGTERAQQAADTLVQAGYADVSVMQEGLPGWRAARLPTTTDNRDGISYASLLTPVKRKGKKKTAVHA
jgi:rhodanese-related sulfurtransferase